MASTIPSPQWEASHAGSPGGETASSRRYDLDWLRVIAILLLLFFHCGMAFAAEWGWHIKNGETSEIFHEWMFFLSRWRMALLFLISGVGTYFVIRRSSAGTYLYQRVLRLFVPLAFGIFVVVPPQIYMERLAQGAGYDSYFAFYPSVFEFEPYPAGNTSWHHLWFVAYLFIYSVIATPLFVALRSEAARHFVAGIGPKLSAWMLYAFALPLASVYAGLIVRYPGPQNIVNDWAMFAYYFLFFLYGYVFSLHPQFWQVIAASRQLSLKLGFSCILVIDYIRWNDLEPAFEYSIANILYRSLIAFNAWFWVMALLGYGKQYLSFKHPILSYANEGIYPFYILHQTVIVVLVYYVVQTSDSILTKFMFLVFASFVITTAIYHFVIRPYNPLRFLFGMKPREGRAPRGGSA